MNKQAKQSSSNGLAESSTTGSPDSLDDVLTILGYDGKSRPYTPFRSPPTSPRNSLRLKSPPTSPRGSIRSGNNSNAGSAGNSVRTRRASRPTIPDFTSPNTHLEPKQVLTEEERRSTRMEKIEAIKKRIRERRAHEKKVTKLNHAPQILESSSPLVAYVSHSPRQIELLLYGIHENSESKTIRIISDDSMSVVISILDQLTPINEPEHGVVTRLDLQKNRIGGKGAKLLCECLLQRKTLEILDVSNNTCLFTEVSTSNLSSRFSTGKIGAEGYLGAESFGNLITEHPNLALLMINDCGLNDLGASFIARGIKNNSSLVFLDIGNNKLTDTGANYICDALRQHSSIRHILLDGNKLTDQSAEQLLTLVQTNTRILTLEINDISTISQKIAADIKEQVNKNRAAFIELEKSEESNDNHEAPETSSPTNN